MDEDKQLEDKIVAEAEAKRHPYNARDDKDELTAEAKHRREHHCYDCRRAFRKGEPNLVCLREGVGVMRLCRPCGKKDGESRLLGAGVYVGSGGVDNLNPIERDRVARRMKKLKREAKASAKRERARIARMPKKSRQLAPDGEVVRDVEVQS